MSYEQIGSVETIDVDVATLDSYQFDNLGFIKIDVEGHEHEVLAGAAKTIARHRPNMLIESNEEHSPGAIERLSQTLDDFGYEAAFLTGSKSEAAMLPIDHFDRDQFPGIENFICVHKSTDTLNAVQRTLTGH